MKKRVKGWMIGSYFFVLVIFLLIYLAIRQQTGEKIRELYMERQRMVMNQTMLAVDEQVDTVRKMCLSIAQEPYVQYFPFVGKELSRYDQESVTKLIQNIRSHYTDNPFIEDVYLFYENSGRIANANGFYPEEDFYHMEWAYEDPRLQSQAEGLLREKGSFFLPSAWMNNGSRRTENIAFFYEISHGLGNREGKSAKLVVLLKKEWMDELIIPVSENGKVSIRSAYDKEEVYSFCGKGFLEKNCLRTRLDSEKSGWIYESAIPYAMITNQMKEAVSPMTLGLFLYLLIGIPACLMLAIWNYKPIRQLTVHMEKIGFQGEAEHRNEVEYIRSGIVQLHQKYEELEKKYDSTRQEFDSASKKLIKNRERLQEGILLQLIGGYWRNKEEVEERLQSLGIIFPYPDFCMVLIQIEDGSWAEMEAMDAEETELRLFVLKNVAQEFLAPLGRIFPVSAGSEQIYLVLNLNCPKDVPESSLVEYKQILPEWERLLQEMMDYFQKELGIVISIGVGTVSGGLKQLKVSFQKAKQALEYGFILGKPSVIVYDQIKPEEKKGFFYDGSVEKQLLGRLLRKDEEGCRLFLDELYEEVLKQKISVEEGRGLHMRLADMAMEVIEQSNVSPEAAEECQDMVAGIFCSKTLPEAFSSVKKLFVFLCAEKKEKDGSQELENRIMQVINEHYQDPAFSLSECAEFFHISPEHLSRTIRLLTGRKFVDIVNGLRLEQAKKYLLETDKKIEEIAELSGYGTAKSFFRSFKQAEGVPPGVWRKENKTISTRQ